jgi:hypothetical protein
LFLGFLFSSRKKVHCSTPGIGYLSTILPLQAIGPTMGSIWTNACLGIPSLELLPPSEPLSFELFAIKQEIAQLRGCQLAVVKKPEIFEAKRKKRKQDETSSIETKDRNEKQGKTREYIGSKIERVMLRMDYNQASLTIQSEFN